jgi:DNA polymerase V
MQENQKKNAKDILKLLLYKPDLKIAHKIPLLEGKVRAGFPSSAENYAEKSLDLNELVVRNPSATFFIRVQGNSMENAGIKNNDILVVDRAVQAADNKIVIARINDELTVKRIRKVGDHLFLMPDAADATEYKPIKITDDMDFEVWGVVTFVIHHI